ncbi:hypothetical protein BDV26DRAFT_286778 [Aspergillus bertholletiae]|uniref:Alpha/Beta hydrolase protein n=1 Tax=Aspergillus bertholletiae TaxID=1226010 RepID=A0A5N7ANM3_9EURO|nr:hypothetical protein BDV26DRAFT_286778 [Aspergillus bertholletiae]
MLQPFDLQLPDGNNLTGRVYTSVQTSNVRKYLPLLVCVHGGSYITEYFNIDSQHSVARVSQALEVLVISISRPSYGRTIWKGFGSLSGATSVVLLAHSIGAIVATIAAGCHIGAEGYPLAGLITSSICVEHLPHKTLVDPAVCLHTDRLNKPVPSAELHNINVIWLEHGNRYSNAIQIPLMYRLGEFDRLFPHIECGIVPIAPHFIEMSFQGTGWLYRCFGFACECAVSQGILPKS